jgi:uncharacterized protein YegJ (DUF2314 family)
MRIVLLTFCFIASVGFSQSPLAPNAPADTSQKVAADKVAAYQKAIAPYIAKARETYPAAKKRYLAGLPPKHVFFLTTKLHDAAGKFEQVFIEVSSIAGGKVTGFIASDIELVEGFKKGAEYTFPETDMLDWLISKPDGTEEGNFVGKFLDHYKP